MNPVDNFIKQIKKVDNESAEFYADCHKVIDDTLGDRYEGGKLDTYLTDIEGHEYEPKKVKEYLVELVQRIDRTDRSGSDE